jgi:hypothetical protein
MPHPVLIRLQQPLNQATPAPLLKTNYPLLLHLSLTPKCTKTSMAPSNSITMGKARIPDSGKKLKMVPRKLDTSRSQTETLPDTSMNTEMNTEMNREIISVISPKSSDKIPPDRGINFKVIYSINYGPAPANVTIRLVRKIGDYDVELYSGPPLDIHSIPRPVETDTWPILPDKAYRIVVTSDDGRTGQSQKFSLSPYVFYLIRPNHGETYPTSRSSWQFEWYAENSIRRIECIILKGGVEEHTWSPPVSPPKFLYGDEITMSPSAIWYPDAGEDYKLRIRGYINSVDSDGDSPPSLLVGEDESDVNFTILDDWMPPAEPGPSNCAEHNPISIESPATTVYWEKTREYNITWCVYDESVTTVNLYLVNASTDERWPVAEEVSGHSTMWTVPEYLEPAPATHYYLHVESADGRYASTSGHAIMIVNWLADPSSPEYREVWRLGETRTIEWESAGLSDQTVDITLRRPGAYRAIQITDGIPNTGSFDWLISADTLLPEDTIWENAYLTIVIGGYHVRSEYFTISR